MLKYTSTCSHAFHHTPLQPAFWGDTLAATTSSVWYIQPAPSGTNDQAVSDTPFTDNSANARHEGKFRVRGAVQIITNVSVHGSWHHPGDPPTGTPTGLACLTASLPLGGDWYYPSGTVGLWFCDGANKTETGLTEWLISDGGDAPMVVMATNTDMCLTAVDSVPQVRATPQCKSQFMKSLSNFYSCFLHSS